MNYRHAFHAGNFADLVKHAALLALLARMVADRAPVTVIDTHAGRGLYDLTGADSKRSGEAEVGIARLVVADDAPPEFSPLLAKVAALNGGGPLRRYPGSPWLIAQSLRPQDRYIACELRADEQSALSAAMKGRANVETLCSDGYATALARIPPRGPALVLIDPPFERSDDYVQVVTTLAGVLRRNASATGLAWLPLKDLETFDGFLRNLEDVVDALLLIAETRMRPLVDPMKMNGCVLVLVNPPTGMDAEMRAICDWTARRLGDQGEARVYAL